MQKLTSNMDNNIQWRVPSIGALFLVLVFMPHLFSKAPYVNAAWVFSVLINLHFNLSRVNDSKKTDKKKKVISGRFRVWLCACLSYIFVVFFYHREFVTRKTQRLPVKILITGQATLPAKNVMRNMVFWLT